MSKDFQRYVICVSVYDDYAKKLDSSIYFGSSFEITIMYVKNIYEDYYKGMVDLGYTPKFVDGELNKDMETLFDWAEYIQKHWECSITFTELANRKMPCL
jgi:hypothetical protein